MKVAFVISSLRSGGAERVVSTMANYWARKGWKVSILTLSGRDQVPFYALDPSILHVPLGLEWVSHNKISALASNIWRIWVLRRTLARLHPDVVISFMVTTNVLAVLASAGLRMPVVVSVRNDPGRTNPGSMWRRLREPVYSRASAVVVQTDRARDYFPTSVRRRCHVIPNPVSSPYFVEGGEDDSVIVGPAVAAMGRLTEQKGFDLLLRAFARLRQQFPEWNLVILGEGPLRPRLESQVAELGLEGRVVLLGQVKNPERVLRQASLFVLSSRFEGFPNALCEAMACGLPVVSFDCPYGPREIIRDRLDGILVPPENVDRLVAAMSELMADEPGRRELARRAVEITSRFSLERTMNSWERVLERLPCQGAAS